MTLGLLPKRSDGRLNDIRHRLGQNHKTNGIAEHRGRKLKDISRRHFAFGALSSACLITASCTDRISSARGTRIDARVDATLSEMHRRIPDTRELSNKAVGLLVMPVISEFGFFFGGAYGNGALRVDNKTVDYYSLVKGSGGFQFGGQQYAHVLFFMTEDALNEFLNSEGWIMSADLEYAIMSEGNTIGGDTATSVSSVVAVVFGQPGIRVGAKLSGMRYTRLDV